MTDLTHGTAFPPHGSPEDFGTFVPTPVQPGPHAPEFPVEATPPQSPWPRRWFWAKRAAAAAFLLLVAIVIWLAFTAPMSKSLEPIAPPQLTLLTADGQPIARNGAIMDKPVRAGKLPDHVKQAFIAIEDRRFYSHFGVDPRGLVRAFVNNLGSGGTQGGSTITQQLAKITFLTPERSLTRKARELLIAFWLEAWLTKDEILERYLSNVYFGDNVFGLRAASMHYFFRQPERLTVAQAAMLAGLVQAPSRLAPTRNPKAAAKRARLVLNAMADMEFITTAKAKGTGAPALDLRSRNALPTGTYFADWAMPVARAQVDASYGEQKIVTTLDSRMQAAARRAIANAPLGKAQVALIAMRPNGEVVAMVGGKSYKSSSFNRATQARRQPGSTFKLFVYTAALRDGMTPDSKVDDSPIETGVYKPKNSDGRYRGEITLRQAFARSSNVAAVRLYQKMGDRAVIRAARDLGVRSPLNADPSLALGSSGITLLELTSAYAAIAANQWPVRPQPVTVEEPGFFEGLFDGRSRFGSRVHGNLEDLLRAVVTQGTGQAAQLRIEARGKTGTSQDNRDALFVGYAGGLVVGVWVGNDDNTPLKGITGGGLPARIWRDFMSQAVKGAGIAPAPPKPKSVPRDEPVVPLDLPELPDLSNASIRIDDKTDIRIEPGEGVRLKTELNGIPLDVRLGKDGLKVD